LEILSSNNSNKTVPIGNASDGKYFTDWREHCLMEPLPALFPLKVPSAEGSMTTKPEQLKDYVRRYRAEHDPPLSLQDVEDQSARYGMKIDASYVSKIENGHKRNPGADALVGLAYGLGRPLLEVLAVATGKPLKEADAQDELLLTLFHNLEPADRGLAIKLIRTVHRARGNKPADVKQIKKRRRDAA
jgi:transcriptional regulator with XRE-family HTH domain